jgi:ornithine cyclodeaminase/alanine dehydrogenase-like protein (mu-crystallin family)
VVPDVLAQAVAMGDLHHALAAGIMTAAQIHGDLASVVTGRVRGRTSADEVFVFDSTGTAAADLAAAELVYTTLRNDPDVPRFDFAP